MNKENNSLQNESFTTSFMVDQSPKEVFDAITNIRGWWSEEIEGDTARLNDEFTYHYEDIHYCQVRLVDVIPNQKVVWLVKYNYFKFTKDKSEWTGNTISFDIAEKDGKTELCFTHHGLAAAYECYDICSNAWNQYIKHSLYSLITTGEGQPNGTDKPQTQHERQLAS